jgi:hypothetical protein
VQEDRPITYTKKKLQEFFSKNAGSFDLSATTENGRQLFTCTGNPKNTAIKITCNSEDSSNVSSAGMMSGIIHQQVALTHGEIEELASDEQYTTHHARGFTEWFQKITKRRILIPDTNTLINRSISSLRHSFTTEFSIPIAIKIPRIVLLEIERAANNAKPCGKRNRKSHIISSVGELDYLKENGASYLPELSDQIFEAFSRIAKDQKSDSWIRHEILKEKMRQNLLPPH